MTIAELLGLPDGPEKTAGITHWLQSLYGPDEEPPVLVGGSAVELYSGGAYTTGDLDFVGHVPARVSRLLKKAGFEKQGRHFIHERGQVYIEFPSASLGPTETSLRKRMRGRSIVIISLEDLIIDRLAAWKFWNSSRDAVNAFLLYRRHKNSLDISRLEARAKEEDLESAWTVLEQFASEHSKRRPGKEELEKWATREL